MTIVAEQDFQRYARDTQAQTATDELRRALAAAEQAVRSHCHRSFELIVEGADASTRYFRPMSSTVAYVDDFTGTTGLTITNDGTTVSADAYDLDPVNGLDDAGNAVPFTKITLHSGSWTCNGRPTVGVTTDQWGWSEHPEAIKEAIVICAKDVAVMRNAQGGVVAEGAFGPMRARVTPDAAGLLQNFVRYDRAGIA